MKRKKRLKTENRKGGERIDMKLQKKKIQKGGCVKKKFSQVYRHRWKSIKEKTSNKFLTKNMKFRRSLKKKIQFH